MNRIYEFRAWDLIAKQMIYLNESLCSIPYYEIFCHTPDERPWELMQFIDSHDKNGKKIFKGDIVRTDEAGWIGYVVFNHGMFYVKDKKGGFASLCNWEKYEVLGNIYENPELLEE